MKTNREAYISIIKRRDEYLENKKRQNTIIVRSAVIASGVCAAAAIGIGIAVNNEIHNPEANIPTAEIPAVTAVTDAYEPVNTEPFSSAVTEPDSSYETSISASTEYTETQSTDTQSTFTQSNNKETTGTEPEKNNNMNETVQSTEKPSGEKTETDKPQSTTDSRPADDRPQNSEPEKSEPVVTEPQEQPDIPLTEEEIAMKEKYKKAAAFLTAMASMAGSTGIVSAASEVKVTEDDKALVYIDQNHNLMDFDGSGEFDPDDIYALYTYINERESLPEEYIKSVEENADVNNDGKINDKDVTLTAGYYIFNVDWSLLNFSDLGYGSDNNKEGCKSFYNSFIFMGEKVAAKFKEPQFRRLCVESESGKINLDINGDGTTDVKDLFDWYLYAVHYDAESDDILVNNPQTSGFYVYKELVEIPIDQADISRIKEAGKSLFLSECPSGDLLDNVNFLKMIGRYVVTYSDISAEQTTAEYYDNIYGIEYSDYHRHSFNTEGESFISVCLSECIQTYSGLEENINDISIEKTENFQFIKYSDYAELYCYLGNQETVVIPSEFDGVPVTTICDFAFDTGADFKLKEVVIPDTVTAIGMYAFSGCSNLESIVIPDSVKSVGQGAFRFCESLREVKLPENIDKIPLSVFEGCTSLESIKLPENITEIENLAFTDCTSLESINLPEKLTVIGKKAFMNTGLREITIPDNISIEYGAFHDCINLETVHLGGENIQMHESSFEHELQQRLMSSVGDDGSDDAARGDVNGDGKTDVTDLSLVSLAIVGDIRLTAEQSYRCDFDQDNRVSLADLATLRQFISKVTDLPLLS